MDNMSEEENPLLGAGVAAVRHILNRSAYSLAMSGCRIAFAFLILNWPVHELHAQTDSEADAIIQARVGQLRNGSELRVRGNAIASMIVLPDFYERREFSPAWGEAENLNALLAAIEESTDDGLNTSDYHLGALRVLLSEPPSAQRTADLDLLATDAVVRLAYHLRFGKIDVTRIDPRWNFKPDIEAALAAAPARTLAEALDQRRVQEALGALHPTSPLYAALRRGLATYQGIRAEGGWKVILPGRPIRPGATDPRAPALRARLAVERDLPPYDEEAGALYDSELEIGVRRFQERHGLARDGIVGSKTLEALNVPVETRINQLRVALEQGRQTLHDLPQRFVLVNVPAFRLYYADETGRRFATNVVVGRRFTQTPIFRSEMTHVVINPSWTVPPGILRRDILPGLARDPDYLKRKGLVRVGDQYVQPPGPSNAMGRIKLMFPNPYLVYLHDTPQKDLLDAHVRLFSSGCIRVQNVFDLADLILDDPTRWSKQQLLRVVQSERTQTVILKRRVPVLLVYWTAAVSPVDDRVFFYADVYGRDAAMLAALDGPFAFSPSLANRAAAVSQGP